MAKYEENKEQIKQDSLSLCLSIPITTINITMKEIGGSYVSEDEQQKAYRKPLLDKGIEESMAGELASAMKIRQDLDNAKEEGQLYGRERCMDVLLPAECSDIAKIGLEYKYFPERLDELKKLQEGADKCSYML